MTSKRPMTINKRYRTEQEAADLEDAVADARDLAARFGLDPYDVKYWIVDYDEMNELIAYGGFQERYPHWRWGMQYDHQRKKDQLGMGKAFEIVNNDDPSNAFLQVSNSMADQKAVITHVEAHADFFANNEWFGLFNDGDVDAVSMLSRHAETIESYMDDPDIDREEVEAFIDTVTCLEDTIDQHRAFPQTHDEDASGSITIEETIEALDLDNDVESQVFDEDWISEHGTGKTDASPEQDVLKFLIEHGHEYDEDADRAVELPDWKIDILQILRTEAYYFAPQKMTKITNEGFAAFWESRMMADENFAGEDEFLTYADHMSKVLGAGGVNPYSLGMQLWEYVENRANRREVLDKLLRVAGVDWRTIHEDVDFDAVMAHLEPDRLVDAIDSSFLPDTIESNASDPRIDETVLEADDVDLDDQPWTALTYEGMAERHYSLCRPQNRSFLQDVSRSDLEEQARYIVDRDRYETIQEAIADVDYTAGWNRMRDVRASHNDVTFIDEFLTQEFVETHNYFTYEYTQTTEDHRVSSVDYEDVKTKLLLQFTNFGKPTIIAYDHNFHNRNELLLGHKYNGIMLDMEEALAVLKRIYELWGRPVNLMTVIKDFDEDSGTARDKILGEINGNEPEAVEIAQRVRYDGEDIEFHPLDPELQEYIVTDGVNYDTKPDEWYQ